MSQRAVESLLGRLLTDEGFRCQFYAEPAVTCRSESLDVTSRELEAILTLDEVHLSGVAGQLDPRIVRATVRHEEPASRVKSGSKSTGAKLTAVK